MQPGGLQDFNTLLVPLGSGIERRRILDLKNLRLPLFQLRGDAALKERADNDVKNLYADARVDEDLEEPIIIGVTAKTQIERPGPFEDRRTGQRRLMRQAALNQKLRRFIGRRRMKYVWKPVALNRLSFYTR